MRTLLYEGAQTLLTNVKKWSWLKAWAMNVAKRRGMKKAIVALARRMAVIMHRMWTNETESFAGRERNSRQGFDNTAVILSEFRQPRNDVPRGTENK
jgi:hypothetical protein